MKIESQPIEFHPSCQFEKLSLTPLQVQYLIFLRMKKSIYDLVQYNLSLGWLVSFKELYALLETLALHHWVLNPEIKNYFKNIHLNQTQKIHSYSEEDSLQNKVTNFSQLLQLPFFRSLDSKLSQFLLQSAHRYQLAPNTLICATQDTTRSLYVLLSGQVGIYKNSGNLKQLTAILNNSSIFGEAGFLLAEKRTADAVTLTTSDLLVIPYNAAILDPYLNKDKATLLQHRFWVQHALLHSEIFKNIPADCLDALTFCGKIVELKQNKILFTQGEQSHSAFILIQGAITIEKDGVNINHLQQGAFLGEIALMASKGVRTATAFSTKDTLLLEIHRNEFYKVLSQNLFLAKEFEAIAHKRIQNDIHRSSN